MALYEAARLSEDRVKEMYPGLADLGTLEDVTNYALGGFHPVDLGDLLHEGRYKVVAKISFGGSAVVWLARDLQEERWVSIKIKSDKHSTPSLARDPEVHTLLKLDEYLQSKETAEKPPCFASLLDFFQISGPNGTHNCLVLELMGPSLKSLLNNHHEDDNSEDGITTTTFLPSTILRSTKQLLEAVKFAHEAGFVHGDISPGNCVFTCYRYMANEEVVWKLFDYPKTVEYSGEEPRLPRLPKAFVSQSTFKNWPEDEWEDLRLVDWHGAFPFHESRLGKEVPQVARFKSPENIFTGILESNHDLWSVGCMIYLLFFQEAPFDGEHNKINFIKSMMAVIGTIPQSLDEDWRRMCRARLLPPHVGEAGDPKLAKVFETRYRLIKEICTLDPNTATEAEETRRSYDVAHLGDLLELLKGLLRFEPDKRMSLNQALRDLRWIDFQRKQGFVEETSEDTELEFETFVDPDVENEEKVADEQDSEPIGRALSEVTEERLNRHPI